MNLDFWLQLILAVGAALGVYVGVKVDITTAVSDAKHAAELAKDAHIRINDHINISHLKGQ